MKKPVSPEQQERIRKLAKEGKVILAPDHKLKEDPLMYAHLMDMIETIMGGHVFISDESTIWDFPEGFREKLEAELGFSIEWDETFVEIVKRMAEMSNPQ